MSRLVSGGDPKLLSGATDDSWVITLLTTASSESKWVGKQECNAHSVLWSTTVYMDHNKAVEYLTTVK